MYLKQIEINNFRNYENAKIKFNKNINVLFGDNAQGKTNIIEAIFISGLGKSFRTNKENELIKWNEKFAKVKINYQKKDRDGEIEIILSEKKVILHNGVKLKKLSELVGNINLVIFTPDDINILKEGPSKRRKFLDILISQLRPNYIYNLNLYNKVLEQRNNFLKTGSDNLEMLEIWNEKLIEYSNIIYNYRKEFIEKIREKIQIKHSEIVNEKIEIKYKSDFTDLESFRNKIKSSVKNDFYRGYTTLGIHKDDFSIFINGKDVSIFGSQGQNRTAVLSLKLSEIEIIFDEINEYPILLLDDFMSELDEKRISNFLSNINKIQVIITCTKNMIFDKSNSFFIKEGNIST